MYACQSLLQRSRVSDSSTPSHGRREPLTKEGIVVVALTIVDREGLSALNMRHLGAALGFKAMAVYKHYPNKAAILDGVVAAVFDDLDEATIEDDWRAGLRGTFLAVRRLLQAHPNTLPLVASRPFASPQLTKRLKSTRDLLLRSQLPEDEALHLLHAGLSLTLGYLWLESGGFVGELPNELPFLRTSLDTGPEASIDEPPGWTSPWSRDEDFAAGLELLLVDPSSR